ncbi:MAG: hypothetical protein M3Y43_07235 [Pseudomonadota bacterium]|nr:hypothetical protein [Pseudomonadota bacterium]MDQ2704940.1 hypothetical protein [Pseudomonadota bacterium]
MASAFSRFRGEDDIEAQVAHLAREMSSLKKSLSRRGSGVYDDARDAASDFYGELRDRFSDALPLMRRRTRAAGEVARDHPATAAVVGLVVVGLLVTMLARR